MKKLIIFCLVCYTGVTFGGVLEELIATNAAPELAVPTEWIWESGPVAFFWAGFSISLAMGLAGWIFGMIRCITSSKEEV